MSFIGRLIELCSLFRGSISEIPLSFYIQILDPKRLQYIENEMSKQRETTESEEQQLST